MKLIDDTLARCCFDATFFQQGHFDYCNDDSHCNTAIGFKCHQKTYTCIHEYLLTPGNFEHEYDPGLNPGRPGDDPEKNNRGTG
uniref:Uncharacterized protein n=1 Tax=Romanomermis culicivorax TaxID=13658 RepID=A0A915I5G7_ROMCU